MRDRRLVLLSEETNPATVAGDSFDAFVDRVEPGLKHAFVARFGRSHGVDAASEAMAYTWEHWSEISAMENPAGYLYRVGRSRTRRIRRRTPILPSVDASRTPEVEPQLPIALAELPERQRVSESSWSTDSVGRREKLLTSWGSQEQPCRTMSNEASLG